MKITHYLYNTFLIEEGGRKIAIDPGQNLGLFALRSLIPEPEWPTVTHIVVTHGDPDHHWHTDRVAEASGAPVICGIELTREVDGELKVVDPRGKELTSWVKFDRLHPFEVGESQSIEGVRFEAVRSVHGPIALPIFWYTYRATPGPDERVGLGSMGFRIRIGDKTLLNLGDSLLLEEWKGTSADVLMLPIGGLGQDTWTMDVDDALKAVEMIAPRQVIPCHYSVPLLLKRKFAWADDERFRRGAEQRGAECSILKRGESLVM